MTLILSAPIEYDRVVHDKMPQQTSQWIYVKDLASSLAKIVYTKPAGEESI